MKRSLGKGLSALVQENIIDPIVEITPNQHIQEYSNHGVLKISPSKILPSRYQPRKEFDEQFLKELADSIRTHGIIQPLVVSDLGDGNYELIAGERRLRASIIANQESVPVIVKDYQEKDRLAIALIENIQRTDLNALEIAEAYKEMIDRLSITQEDLSQIIGRSRVSITNTLRLLKLPEMIKEMVLNQDISEGHGRVILALSPYQEVMEQAASIVVEKGLSVRETEILVRELQQINQKFLEVNQGDNEEFTPKRKINEKILAIEEKLIHSLGVKTKVSGNIEKGSIRLFYHSTEELEILMQNLIKK